MFRYTLVMDCPDDLSPEGIARALEDAAEQVRGMSSARAAHSMRKHSCGGEVAMTHGVERWTGCGTPG